MYTKIKRYSVVFIKNESYVCSAFSNLLETEFIIHQCYFQWYITLHNSCHKAQIKVNNVLVKSSLYTRDQPIWLFQSQ